MNGSQKKAPGVGLRDFSDPLAGSKSCDWGVRFLVEVIIGEGELDLDPDYQRGHVWDQAQQEAFIGHMLEGGGCPDLWVRDLPLTDSCKPPFHEIVDGKQRIFAMQRWWNGEICARLSKDNGHREIWQRDMSAMELRVVNRDHLSIHVQHIAEDSTRAQVLKIYLRLNRGIAHTTDELARVQGLLDDERGKRTN